MELLDRDRVTDWAFVLRDRFRVYESTTLELLLAKTGILTLHIECSVLTDLGNDSPLAISILNGVANLQWGSSLHVLTRLSPACVTPALELVRLKTRNPFRYIKVPVDQVPLAIWPELLDRLRRLKTLWRSPACGWTPLNCRREVLEPALRPNAHCTPDIVPETLKNFRARPNSVLKTGIDSKECFRSRVFNCRNPLSQGRIGLHKLLANNRTGQHAVKPSAVRRIQRGQSTFTLCLCLWASTQLVLSA